MAETVVIPPVTGGGAVSLTIYKRLVDKCASERLDYEIANGSAAHARILISKLFEVASTHVEIISGRLQLISDDKVPVYAYTDIIARAKRFLLSPEARLDIVVQTGSIDGERENTFLKEVIGDEARQGTMSVCVLQPTLRHRSIPHMMISDTCMYRFETNPDAENHTKVEAVANFGAPKRAEALHEYFRDLLNTVDRARLGERTVYAAGMTF